MRTFLTAGSIAIALLAIFVLSRDILPPKTLVMAVGSPGGGYWKAAEHYRRILARDDIDLQLLESAGSVQNAGLLASGQADTALLQGGITSPPGSQSIGAVFYEPLLIFSRDGHVPGNPARWEGLRIASGQPGSGTRAAFESLIQAAGIHAEANTPLPISGKQAANALLDGSADLAIFVAPVNAPYLAALFDSPAVGLVQLDHIDAIASRLQADVTILPSGAASMLPPRPAQPVALVVTTAQIVASANLHPSLVDRLVEAAREVHAAQNVITPARRFPARNGGSPPMDPYAEKLIENGPSSLQEYLPYWVVAQINRFAILLLPVLFLLLPLLRTLPGIYSWQMRRRVYACYPRLRLLDDAIEQASSNAQLDDIALKLSRIDRELNDLKLPLAYRNYAYTARLHADLVRSRLVQRQREILSDDR